jgi:hypothetical protein
MSIATSFKYGVAALSVATAALAPGLAAAQTSQPADKWQTSASIYGFLASISGDTKFPSNGSSVDLSSDAVLDSLKMAFMGSLEVHNGRWGVLNDLMYMNLGASKSGVRDFSLGGGSIPASASANFDYDLKGMIWTVAGEYRLPTGNPAYTVDLLGGARYFKLKQTLGYGISGTVGDFPLAGKSGTAEVDASVWDGIVGVKGRYAFGQNRQWYAPYYLDVGTGQSDLTWQAAGGIGYAFGWGEVTGMWRYLNYNFKSGDAIQSMTFNGPMLGATFRW